MRFLFYKSFLFVHARRRRRPFFRPQVFYEKEYVFRLVASPQAFFGVPQMFIFF